MRRNTKILVILSPGFPKDEADTTCLPSQQIFIRTLNKNFPALKIIILSFQYPFSTLTYRWNANIVIPFNGRSGAIRRLFLWRRLWRTLNTLKKENNIIGLFSFWCGECALIGKWFGKFNNVKHLCWISGQDATKGNRYIKLIRPQPPGLVAMSDFLQHEFHKNYGVKPAHVVPIGIDASMFERKTRQKKDIDIIGVGSLIPLKQYDIFIGIIKVLSANFPSIKTIICGKGPEEKNLQSMIDQMQINKNAVLIGEKAHSEVLQLMQRSKILLHTSSYEGFGAVCIEALYAGCHVISFVKPMQGDTDHWHIVQTKEEMINKALHLLNDTTTHYEHVLAYSMEESAQSIMDLFGYYETE